VHPSGPTAPLVEVFASVQGEGAFVGELQTFLRLAVCPLRCLYCDSERTWRAGPSYRVFENGRSRLGRNPVTPEQAAGEIRAAEGEGPRMPVSLTGGEPLVHADFLAALAPILRAEGRAIRLETAGVHPDGMRKLRSLVDHVSADWKAPSTMERGDFREAQRRFLAEAAGHDLAVKFVVTPGLREKEFVEGVEAVASIAPSALIVVQPATPFRKVRRPPLMQQVLRLASLARERHPRVRVLPQVHRLLRLR
jgi:organic radical activating enzyme